MNISKRIALALAVGFLIGVLGLVGLRFITFQDTRTHYHANFALYINGQRDAFNNFTFYEEVQSCSSDDVNNPRTRVHMHDKVNHVAHVHDPASTWGHLFANLSYTLGNDLLKTDKGIFTESDKNKLTFMLNGKEIQTIANEPIRSEDVLLINYGNDPQELLESRYDTITKDAADYNKRTDPSSCKGSKSITFMDRLKHALGF